MSIVDTIELLYGPPMDVVSNCLRGCITAGPGKDLVVADFSSIEARGLAWLAGEQKLIDVFKTGADVYCAAAEDIYGRPINKKDNPEERQIGKVTILACGYQGSVGAFQSMARVYLVKVDDKEALKIVKAWRAKNENIVSYWRACEQAAIDAVKQPGEKFYAGAQGRRVGYIKKGSFLFCRLPSGRMLSYPYPRLVPYVWIAKKREDGEHDSRRVPDQDLWKWINRGWRQNGEPSAALHYKYVDGLTKKWTEGPTYGGSLVENITQAICRDILAEAMVRLEHHDYEIVMHVHDEIVSEVPVGFGSVDEMGEIMSQVPEWATGFPIAAEGWRGKRYRK
jgi:DNA polymerase bacteriophage-type